MTNKSGLLTKTEKGVIFMSAKRKVSWRDIFDNFKTVYPTLSKNARDFRPHDYMSIIVYFRDGSQMIYDDVRKRGKLIVA